MPGQNRFRQDRAADSDRSHEELLTLFRLARLRLGAINRREIRISHYQRYREDGGETDQMLFTSRNLVNIFEVPVLFFVVCILIYVTANVDMYYVLLAWVYVLGRYVHTYIHVTSNDVRQRFFVYMATNFVMLAIWVRLVIDIAIVGGSGA